LLPKPSDSEQGSIYTYPTPSPSKLFAKEIWLLSKASLPVILAYTLQNSLQTLSVLIVGRLSPEALATAAFSYMFATCTAWLLGLGGTTAIDTLASSTFTGSSNPHDLGIILQRAFLVLGLMYLPVSLLWFYSAPLFRALGQEEYICVDAARFLTALIPGGLGYVYFESLKKFLQAQGLNRAGTYVLCLTSPVNAALNYLLIYTAGMGLLGAPIATGISYWLSVLLLLIYIRFSRARDTWGGFSKQALRNTLPFTKLALAGIVHVGTEWWAFEVVALAAGRLGTIPLAAQSVIMTSDQVINTVPFGIGVAASSRVGNLLGARDATGAKRASHAAAWLSILAGTALLVVLLATRDVFGLIFNDDADVVALVSHVMPLVALFQIADGLNGSCGGALRGMGRQHVGALVNVVSYYGGALPLGVWLAFHGWGLQGLWVGQCVALYCVGVLEWAIVGVWTDFERQVEYAFERMDSGDEGEAVLAAETMAH
jgi:MATE family multidrug resistance protein